MCPVESLCLSLFVLSCLYRRGDYSIDPDDDFLSLAWLEVLLFLTGIAMFLFYANFKVILLSGEAGLLFLGDVSYTFLILLVSFGITLTFVFKVLSCGDDVGCRR